MDIKKTYDELESDLKAAASLVKPGSYYSHYKHPEIPYVVKGMLVMEENNEIAVRYESTARPGVEFVRPLKVWLETVSWEGKTLPRFTLIDGPLKRE